MAPVSVKLLPRQFGNGNGNGPFGDRDGRNSSGISKWAIIGIVVAIVLILVLIVLGLFRRNRKGRKVLASAAIGLSSLGRRKPKKSTGPSGNSGSGPPKYGDNTTGYGATPDQNHSLLASADPPAIVMWNPPNSDNAGSTQDGFGYDNNLQLAGAGIQRPASVASFSAPPPRYEEAAAAGARLPGQAQPQGEAASYFNATVPMGDERGRSRSTDAPAEASRGRALSVDTRSMNGDRRRSISRFREEGMVDVNVNAEKS
ncbi:hypothetical protein PV04_01788 [Phialophora macrospora]|uniref:Uncharacterized protein n=1 Tax=Phialophora macrospora TaxID=1851006 RepID=A0A0D2G4F9_9EURO|nr:hypothetical protein PV04_01788 [Phialophora macrospora]